MSVLVVLALYGGSLTIPSADVHWCPVLYLSTRWCSTSVQSSHEPGDCYINKSTFIWMLNDIGTSTFLLRWRIIITLHIRRWRPHNKSHFSCEETELAALAFCSVALNGPRLWRDLDESLNSIRAITSDQWRSNSFVTLNTSWAHFSCRPNDRLICFHRCTSRHKASLWLQAVYFNSVLI